MKKLFTLVLTFAALLSSTQVWAATYGLLVCGVQVTDSNKDNITASGISGTISYNPDNKRLTIAAGTTINSNTDGINNTGIDGLSILFAGDVTINSKSDAGAGIFCQANTTLTCYSGSAAPNVTINCTGKGNAICSYRGAKIYTYSLRITAKASSNHAISSIIQGTQTPSISFGWTKLYASAPDGYAGLTGFTGGITFSASTLYGNEQVSNGTVVNSSGDVLKNVYVYPHVMIGACNLSTGETTLNTTKTGATSASGTVQYNASTKTLTLTNVNVDGANLVTYVPDNLTINFSGDGAISSNGYTMDLYNGNTAITSDGTVTITSTGRTAVYVNGTYSLSISAPGFVAQSTATDYSGLFAGSSTVTMNKYNSSSLYKFVGPKYNMKVKKLVMNDIDISTGSTYWNSSDGYTYYNGEIAKGTELSWGTWFKATSAIGYYDLWVAGTHVRTNNTQYIASPYMNGLATYDNSTKTLTMADKTISGLPSEGTSQQKSAIYSTIQDLIINATGTNNWKSSYDCLVLGGSGTTTINGSGNLYITSSENSAINMFSSASLTLARSGGDMQVLGKQYGFYGVSSGTLTINKEGDGSIYKFAGEQSGNIGNTALKFGSGVNISTGYHWFNDEAQAVYYKDGVAKTNDISSSYATWIRSNVTWTNHPIYIAGTKVYTYDGNTRYLWNKYVKGGYISYNPSTNTLKLENATIDKGDYDWPGIYSTLEDLVVNVTGTSEVKSTGGGFGSLYFSKNTTIQGSGTLNLTGSMGDLYAYGEGTTVKINDVNLNAERYIYSSSSNGKLEIDMATDGKQVKAKYVYNWNSITLGENTAIVEPMKAVIADGTIKVGSSYAQDVVITKVEKYDLAVCNVDVNSYNKDDILRDGGSFKYDPNMKRLTITNADVDDTSVDEGIWNKGIEGLNIAINGENKLRFNEDIFCLAKSTTFGGKGTIKGELTSSTGYGIYLSASNVIGNLNGPKFDITGYAGVGDGGYSNTNLIIEKGCLAFTPRSSDGGRILYVKNLTLGEGMIIAEPKGGTFDSNKKGIVVDGSLYIGHAAITMNGDVNLDGDVTIADGVAVLNAMAGDPVAGDADVNGDGDITIADFVAVLNIMAN